MLTRGDSAQCVEVLDGLRRPGCARMDRLTIGPQVANLPHKRILRCCESFVKRSTWLEDQSWDVCTLLKGDTPATLKSLSLEEFSQ